MLVIKDIIFFRNNNYKHITPTYYKPLSKNESSKNGSLGVQILEKKILKCAYLLRKTIKVKKSSSHE